MARVLKDSVHAHDETGEVVQFVAGTAEKDIPEVARKEFGDHVWADADAESETPVQAVSAAPVAEQAEPKRSYRSKG